MGNIKYIQINDSNREVILELFNKSIDGEGFIIEKKTQIRLTCPYSKQNIRLIINHIVSLNILHHINR